MNGSAANSRSNASSGAARRSRLIINGPLGVSVIALVLGASVIAAGAATLLASVFSLSLGEDDPQKVLTLLDEAHNKKITEDRERFIGRSVFFKPPAPPPVQREVVREIPRPAPLPVQTAPPIPSNYTGPSISYAWADLVCFKPDKQNDKQFTVRVGEEGNGVRVIAMNLPWSVKLGHAGGEYDVQIFKPMDEAKYLPTQARPTIVVKGLIEVPPPQMKVPAIQAPDNAQIIQSAAAAENLERAREARRSGPARGTAQGAPADREARRMQQEQAGAGRGEPPQEEVEEDEEPEETEEPEEDDSIAEDEDEPIEDEVPADPEAAAGQEQAGLEQQGEGAEAVQDDLNAEAAPAGEPPIAMDRS